MFFSPSTNGFYDPEIHGQNMPGDVVQITKARHIELLAGQSQGKQIVVGAGGLPVLVDPTPPTFEAKVAAFRVDVQEVLDAKAIAMGYDNIATAVSYADEPVVPQFQLEGRSLRAWRSLVWQSCYALLAQVQAGQVPEPTKAEVLASLPAFSMLEA